MYGTIIADDKGWLIESLYTMWDEPTMLVHKYRVMIMDGRPQFERQQVQFRNGIWEGTGVRAGTDNLPPESTERIAIKRPRGKKVWRDGEWRKS